MNMQKSTMRIEDACIWRKALAEHPDETMTILVWALRNIAALRTVSVEVPGMRVTAKISAYDRFMAQKIAEEALTEAGFETGIKETK